MNSTAKKPQVVLVTGGTSGIGLETVKQFAAIGSTVYACARHEFDYSRVVESSAMSRVRFTALDLNSVQDLVNWIDKIGEVEDGIDVLVNNAAVVVKKKLTEFSRDELKASLDVNLLAVVEAVKASAPYLNSHSSVVNLSSMAAIDPFPGFSVYGACKSFIELFTKAISSELAEQPVHCYSIRAGAVDTPLLKRVLPEFPAEQCLAPADVATLILELATGQVVYGSGAVIEISIDDNGQTQIRSAST